VEEEADAVFTAPFVAAEEFRELTPAGTFSDVVSV
jgi:hypothetical protein